MVKSYRYPWISALIRPVIFLTLFRGLRNYFYLYLRAIVKSLPMVMFIVIFILYFAWIAFTIF